MQLIPQILPWQDSYASIRRQISRRYEQGTEMHYIAELVADLLLDWGYDVYTGIGGVGVVGVLKNGSSSKSIAIRADMGLQSMKQPCDVSWGGEKTSKMFVCGDDDHSAILLCAAQSLAAKRSFDGTLNLIFQPVEEGQGGARRMIEDGLFERFPCDAVYALHSMPCLPVGMFVTHQGVMSASFDVVTIKLRGVGNPIANSYKKDEPIIAIAELVLALQTVVARKVPGGEVGVISVVSILAGEASSAATDLATLTLNVHSTNSQVRMMLKKRINAIAKGVALAHELKLDFDYDERIGVLINSPGETSLLQLVAREISGDKMVLNSVPDGYLTSDDFGTMLEARPGCYFIAGNGKNCGPSDCVGHKPSYELNDLAMPSGASLWVRLVETYLNEA